MCVRCARRPDGTSGLSWRSLIDLIQDTGVEVRRHKLA